MMVSSREGNFNLWDTNGRRRDVLNALHIYLDILEEMREEYPGSTWKNYPESIAQFIFYEKAIQRSPEVFRIHGKYDHFLERLGNNYEAFVNGIKTFEDMGLEQCDRDSLDKDIEARSRHYTSNLVRLGFADSQRNISPAGRAYRTGHIQRDSLERMLPLDDTNIILLRQLSKLRVFSTPNNNGYRSYYSPFYLALHLLLHNEALEKNTFFSILQGVNSYLSESDQRILINNPTDIATLNTIAENIEINVPRDFQGNELLSFDVFSVHIKNSKSGATVKVYYEFYCKLFCFRNSPTPENYSQLMNCLIDNRVVLNKAFGYGRSIFSISRRRDFGLEGFLEENRVHPFFQTTDFNSTFYTEFMKSGRIDDIREYSDTTERLMGATGLFRFRNLPEIAFKEVISIIYDKQTLPGRIFGAASEEEYLMYEGSNDGIFYRDVPLSVILGYNEEEIRIAIEQVEELFGTHNPETVHERMTNQLSVEFANHVEEKYSKEVIMRLLPLFSDRRNDPQIKAEVNDTADIPTIYEFIVGIAWYYILGKRFDLYSSFNLTMNADYEPIMHAGGGEGDIVVEYEEMILLIEATLMNAQAQRRGEWEPVLRHSLNLKADVEPKEAMTFFVADELDFNTINIWRAVASVSLESTRDHEEVSGVVIMPFTNHEVVTFLENNVEGNNIIQKVFESFSQIPRLDDAGWKEQIIASIMQ